MTKHVIALAAAAALGIGTLSGTSRAADETNRVGAQTGSLPSGAGNMGQTGAANETGTSGSGVAGMSNSGMSNSGSSANTGMSNTGSSAQTGSSSPNNVGPVGGEFTMQGSSDIRAALDSANTPDKFFLVCAAIDNQAEMQLAQLAQQKSQDQQVKQFAQQIIQDHQQAQNQLKTAAQECGCTLPHGLPAIKQQQYKVMEGLDGKEFDQKFVSCMRAAHAKAVDEYKDVSQTAKDTQVKDYASKILPTLQDHLQMADKAATALGLPSGIEAQTAGARMSGSSSSTDMNSSGNSGGSGTGMSGSSNQSSGTTGSSNR